MEYDRVFAALYMQPASPGLFQILFSVAGRINLGSFDNQALKYFLDTGFVQSGGFAAL